MRYLRGVNGFSLIELMVIVAIIALVLGLTIPRFMKQRSAAPESPKMSIFRNN